MLLKDFVKQFVAPNSIVRLWKKCDNNRDYEMLIVGRPDGIIMSWEINTVNSYAGKYANCNVLYVKDIVNETTPESINIVIECE